MALVVKDRVQETTTTVGTGTYTLAGAQLGYQSFAAIGNGNTTYYAVTNGTDWEVGIGTYTSSGTTLSRDTILASSNSNNAVNWAAGTKSVFVTYPAGKSLYYDASNNVGIGTSSPGAKLEVNGGDILTSNAAAGAVTNRIINSATAGNVNARFLAGDSGLTQYTQVGWRGATFATSGNRLPNSGFLETEGNTNGLTINTRDSAPISLGTNNAERMRIDSSGNVGIGTSSPTAATKLDVNGYTRGRSGLIVDTYGTYGFNLYYDSGWKYLGNGYGSVWAFGGSGETYLYSAANNTGGAGAAASLSGPHFAVTNAGNVGIGTGSPAQKLDVNGNARLNGSLIWAGSGGTNSFIEGTSVTDVLRLGTVNTERLRIDSSGNVGIGGTPDGSLAPRLYVRSSYSAATAATPYNGIYVASSDAQAADKGGVISLGGMYDATYDTRFAAIAGLKENSTSGQYGGYLSFYTRQHGSNPTERMRIDSSGNVGIGTSSPGTQLEVAKSGADTNIDLFRVSSGGGGGFNIRCSDLAAANPVWTLRTFANEEIAFGQAVSEFMRINNVGNVGIGTTAPIKKLTTVGDVGVSYGSAICFTDGGTATYTADKAIYNYYDGSYDRLQIQPSGVSPGIITFNTGSAAATRAERLRIDSSGNVGIGASAPGATGYTSFLALGNNNAGIGNAGTNKIGIVTNNVERILVDNAGNVGIGTASPAVRLDVQSSGTAVTRISSTTLNGTAYYDISATGGTVSLGREGSPGGTILSGSSAYSAVLNAAGAYPLLFGVNGSERMRIDSAGNVGIGVTPTAGKFHVETSANEVEGSFRNSSASCTSDLLQVYQTNASATLTSFNLFRAYSSGPTVRFAVRGDGEGYFAGNVGIGTSSPGAKLDLFTGGGVKLFTYRDASNNANAGIGTDLSGSSYECSIFAGGTSDSNGVISFGRRRSDTGTYTERMRIEAGGNVGIGVSPSYTLDVQTQVVRFAQSASGYGYIQLGKSSTATNNYHLGSEGDATLRVYNGNWGSGTERMRILSNGDFVIGKTETNTFYSGTAILNAGGFSSTKSAGVVATFRRMTSDGDVVDFVNDAGSSVGTISISGSTVSYNAFAGSHWSQLQDGGKPDILRGTVLESINELCEWPGEDNERLPKCKISDTVSSKRVYGVFMSWDNDWTATNDMFVTGVGAFICRIHGSVTVQEGDLLESNGDGTARVQADDVIRSSTIGKVTSTIKSHEYDDGSYCVPAVLYCG